MLSRIAIMFVQIVQRSACFTSAILTRKCQRFSVMLKSFISSKNVVPSSANSLSHGTCGIYNISRATMLKRLMSKDVLRNNVLKRWIYQHRDQANTVVLNDVVLYRSKDRLRSLLMTIAVPTTCFLYYAYDFYSPWFFTDKYHNNPILQLWYYVCLLSTIAALVCLCIGWFYCTTSVTHIVLRKGGKMVTFSTLNPIKSRRLITVPLSHITTKDSAKEGNVVRFKLKGKQGLLMLDGEGEFLNKELYENTLGYRTPF